MVGPQQGAQQGGGRGRKGRKGSRTGAREKRQLVCALVAAHPRLRQEPPSLSSTEATAGSAVTDFLILHGAPNPWGEGRQAGGGSGRTASSGTARSLSVGPMQIPWYHTWRARARGDEPPFALEISQSSL